MYDERRSQAVLAIVMGVSLLAHAGAWGGLGLLPPLEDLLVSYTVTAVDILEELPPPEPEPELPPAPEPEEPELPPPPEPPVRRERPEAAPEEEPPPEPPPAMEEQIEDFTGETLTNDQGAAWQSAVGNGAPMDAPIGGPTGTRTGRRVEGTEGGVPDGTGTEPGPRLVAVRDLSSPPGAPRTDRLASLIQRFYPSELRRLAVEGRATVRLRIGPDGSVSRLRVRSESDAGFGQACVEALTEAGRWDPGPRDRDGSPVTTEVNFECRFTVRL